MNYEECINLKNKKRSAQYIISFDTFMLRPMFQDNKVFTHVNERNGDLSVPRQPIHIVKNSCDYYGNSLHNSTNSSKMVLGKRHKTPIILAHDFGIPYIFLPTMSPSSDQNVWISYNAIENIEEDNLGCIITLENGRSFKLNVSPTTMYRQYAFATILEKNFLKKQRQLNRPSTFNFFDNLDDDDDESAF